MNNEIWNEICFLLSKNIKNDISESDFEQNVLQVLRILEWKEFKGDIQIRPSFKIGAANRITPDFVINSKENKNLFVIEIKQPSIPINIGFQQQLFSYMRQLRLQYGILIGQVIQVFYDGDLTDHDDPVLLETIEFKNNSKKGEKFVELFSKENFNYESLESFTINSLKRINRKADQKKLLNKILSTGYREEVLELIKQDFLNKYDAEIIENVLQEININIASNSHKELKNSSFQSTTENLKPTISSERDRTRYILNGNNIALAKNRFVLQVVKDYIKQKPTNFNSLKKVFKDEYQGSTGVINKLDFVETKYANKSNKRHFTGSEEILESSDGVKFVVSTEWGKGNIENLVDLAKREGFSVEKT
ncbi:type I restriction enzyme HsdR N-terminal domain-containing protein [Salegentibacter sp. F188]|uniref:Type I restriction enzyme HsdR N-terminal domain-containing protein n=1 Tax=Autumnicola patrickiae TaxID=3075591 RepID=A0ABU3E263_9FLAO|nr:type I restriction enzyme HsdR N-terminal domain-containing protein [Salegentibacter sp. F188]MDT0690067.1 type I restriction enzyme HsdR N-terminal domain-containing protein [Salegentibacter sp. F188]